MYLSPWISKHAWAKFNHGQAVQVQAQELKPMGDHSHITMVLTDCHTFDPLFAPLTSAQNPVFYQKLSHKVLFFPHCPNFLKFFTQRPQIGWNLRQRYPNAPNFLKFCHMKNPLFFALHAHVWEECCSLEHGKKLENFVYLKKNRAIWWILLGANLIKVMKRKIQFYSLNRPNCALWMNFIGGQGWYTGHHPSGQTRKGMYPTTTLYMILHTNAKCTWGCASGGKWKVQCRARWRARENFEIYIHSEAIFC